MPARPLSGCGNRAFIACGLSPPGITCGAVSLNSTAPCCCWRANMANTWERYYAPLSKDYGRHLPCGPPKSRSDNDLGEKPCFQLCVDSLDRDLRHDRIAVSDYAPRSDNAVRPVLGACRPRPAPG